MESIPVQDETIKLQPELMFEQEMNQMHEEASDSIKSDTGIYIFHFNSGEKFKKYRKGEKGKFAWSICDCCV